MVNSSKIIAIRPMQLFMRKGNDRAESSSTLPCCLIMMKGLIAMLRDNLEAAIAEHILLEPFVTIFWPPNCVIQEAQNLGETI